MICKVQTGIDGLTILIYNEDRSFVNQLFSEEQVKQLGGPLVKRYFECEVNDSMVELGEELFDIDF